MVIQYIIRMYINSRRVSGKRLNGKEARFLYEELLKILHMFKSKYGDELSRSSLLIFVDGEEIYRSHKHLKEHGILTIDDVLQYLEIENVIFIIKDNEPIRDLSETISGVYVLEVYTKKDEITAKQLKVLSEVRYGKRQGSFEDLII